MSERPPRWRYSPEELAEAVASSRSYRQVLSALGLSNQGGGAYATLHRRIAQLGIATDHLTGQGWSRGLPNHHNVRRSLPLDALLVRDSPVTAIHRLKKRLIVLGLLEERCQICGLSTVWNGSPLTLRLDHVNGVHNDNRLKNLRLICPNCDSQLPTFAGRNKRRGTKAPLRSAED